MLDPYVAIHMDGPPTEQQRHPIETTYIPEHFRLTPPQLQAIGRVSSTWSVLEHIIEITLSRLSLAPQFPALALTNGLSIDNRIKALKTLTALHRERYREQIIGDDLLRILGNMATETARLKDRRNRVVHLVWISGRSGTEMAGRRPRATTGTGKQDVPDPKLTLDEVNTLADDIQRLADAMFVVAQESRS